MAGSMEQVCMRASVEIRQERNTIILGTLWLPIVHIGLSIDLFHYLSTHPCIHRETDDIK
jgi:hypothetical protein